MKIIARMTRIIATICMENCMVTPYGLPGENPQVSMITEISLSKKGRAYNFPSLVSLSIKLE